MNHTSFLIIGAGPYSIAAAAYAKYLGVDVIIVGKPLELLENEYAARNVFAFGF
jgi:thioredoxin reductase